MSAYTFKHYRVFIDFVVERHSIYLRRKEGQAPPWTEDKILGQYRFCNVYRELDKVTQWIAKHWRTPNAKDPDLWLLMTIARVVNWPDTLATMNFIDADGITWNRAEFLRAMRARKEARQQVYGGAYIISTSGSEKEKAVYLADNVLSAMWRDRENLRPRKSERLATFHMRLMGYNGMGSFMAGQVMADLKYAQPLINAEDWWTFASSGPGSRKGMSMLMGCDPSETKWKEHEWREALADLKVLVDADIESAPFKRRGMELIHAQDLQNCLCEFSKYRRTQLGTGKPKSNYTPTL